MTQNRIDRLFQNWTDDMDVIALNPGQSQLYMLGLQFYIFERPVVVFFVPGKKPALVLPELEIPKAHTGNIDMELFPYGENPAGWAKVFKSALQYLGLTGKNRPVKMGVEAECLRLHEMRFIQAALPEVEFVDADVMTELRMRKDAAEIAAMRKAIDIAQAGVTASIPLIKIGMTEIELSKEIGYQINKAGGEGPSEPIVGGGPNSANPHATPSDRKLTAGDLLVIDFGTRYQGYHSDITRTFAVGEVDAECRKIHQITLEANAAGRAAGRPGIPAGEVDKAARGVIEAAGYGRYFTHRTGHGLGSSVHEPPYMFGENKTILKPGMVYTVEPGIYLEGRNGVRIEDDVCVTDDGAETLSYMPREIITVG